MIFPLVPVAYMYMYIEKGKSEDNETMAKLHIKNSSNWPSLNHFKDGNEREKTVTYYYYLKKKKKNRRDDLL